MILKYVGGGFIPNIPARDMEESELEEYDIDALVKSGLYEKVGRPKVKEESNYGREST